MKGMKDVGTKTFYRQVNIKNGLSPSYLTNNLTKSDNYAAVIKNAFLTSKIVIYKINELENQNLHADLISQQLIEWDSKEKECTHINYIYINQRWYLLVCFIGMVEVYCEDGSKRYFAGTASDFQKHESDLMNSVFLSSCVGVVKSEDDKLLEFIIIGTSQGEIYQMSITKNNSVLQNLDKKIIYKDGKHAITALSADHDSYTVLAGTHTSHNIHLQLSGNNEKMKILTTVESHYETVVTTIGCLKQSDGNYYVVGHANGLVKLLRAKDAAHLCDIQAHSRSINGLVCHPSKPTFATVSDDTMVNLWYAKSDKSSISDVQLLMSQRVQDLLLVGVCFGENNNTLIVSPYDYKFMIHFKTL